MEGTLKSHPSSVPLLEQKDLRVWEITARSCVFPTVALCSSRRAEKNCNEMEVKPMKIEKGIKKKRQKE